MQHLERATDTASRTRRLLQFLTLFLAAIAIAAIRTRDLPEGAILLHNSRTICVLVTAMVCLELVGLSDGSSVLRGHLGRSILLLVFGLNALGLFLYVLVIGGATSDLLASGIPVGALLLLGLLLRRRRG